MNAEPATFRDKVTVDGKPYHGPTVEEVLATPEGPDAVEEALKRMREETEKPGSRHAKSTA